VSVFRRRDKQPTSGPSGPHRFVDPADVRSGLALAAMLPNAEMGPALAVTEASLRCGRPRPDPIHEPSEGMDLEDEPVPEPEPPSPVRRLLDRFVRRPSP
jgi:hypothetical protein